MPRKPIARSNEHYYHITARSNNREFFYLPIVNVWDIMTKKLARLQEAYKIKIAAFVLMNNHFHLLIFTPHEDIDRIMYFFMKEVTLDIQKSAGRVNKIFGGRYKGSMITSYSYLVNFYKYIYRNPVEVGLSEYAELYPYSTLFHKTQSQGRCPFNVENFFPMNVFDDYEDLNELKWINQKFEMNEAGSIGCGLQKTIFSYEKDRKYNRPIVPIIRHPKKQTHKEY